MLKRCFFDRCAHAHLSLLMHLSIASLMQSQSSCVAPTGCLVQTGALGALRQIRRGQSSVCYVPLRQFLHRRTVPALSMPLRHFCASSERSPSIANWMQKNLHQLALVVQARLRGDRSPRREVRPCVESVRAELPLSPGVCKCSHGRVGVAGQCELVAVAE